MSEPLENVPCDICPSGTARFSCCDCQQNCCEVCLTYHQKFEGTCNHTVCQMPCRNQPETSTCPIHNLDMEYRCLDDHMNCCATCKKNCHANCSTIKHFREYIAEKEPIKEDCKKMITGIRRKKEEADGCHKILKQNTENWNKRMHEKLTEMKNAMEDLEGKIQQKQTNLEDFMKSRQSARDTIIQSYDDAIQDLTSKCCKLTTAEKVKSDTEIMIAIQEMEEAVQRHKGIIFGNPCEGHTIALLKEEHKFEAEHYVEATLETMMSTASEINNIYVEMQRNSLRRDSKDETDQKRRHSDGDYVCYRPPDVIMRNRRLSNREKVEHYQSLVHIREAESVPDIAVESVSSVNVHLPGDTEQCAITGIAELANGEIIMADFQNKNLKLISAIGQIIDFKLTKSEPRDIAKIDENNVMVSIPKDKRIQFVEIYHDDETKNNAMTLAKTYRVDGKCCGIAYQNGKIYTATQMPTQILILDMSGKMLASISGDGCFERPTYTVVPSNSSLIFMSDPNHKYVYGLTEDGTIQFKYKVDGPHGLSANDDGDLLIADFDTSSIHLVSTKTGTKIGALSPENCHCPQKVSYNTSTKQLLVTMWNNDTLLKFKLK